MSWLAWKIVNNVVILPPGFQPLSGSRATEGNWPLYKGSFKAVGEKWGGGEEQEGGVEKIQDKHGKFFI